MPTVHREEGIAFRIYPNDHGPPHVHAIKAGTFAKIEIGEEGASPRVLGVGRKLKDADLLTAVRIVERKVELVLGGMEKGTWQGRL